MPTDSANRFILEAVDLYPEIMNIYGDRGNVLYLSYRASLYGILVRIKNVSIGSKLDAKAADIIFMGGGQDAEQTLIYNDFISKKSPDLKKALEDNKVMLAICGSYQLLLDYYKAANGKIIKGVSIFKGYTESEKPRFIGNIISEFFELKNETLGYNDPIGTLVGFENHGGRTRLENGQSRFGTVSKGFGNNGKDKTEGARTGNFFGTYMHGSFLPKNFKFCDYIIHLALIKKYGVSLEEAASLNKSKIDDTFEKKAREAVIKRF